MLFVAHSGQSTSNCKMVQCVFIAHQWKWSLWWFNLKLYTFYTQEKGHQKKAFQKKLAWSGLCFLWQQNDWNTTQTKHFELPWYIYTLCFLKNYERKFYNHCLFMLIKMFKFASFIQTHLHRCDTNLMYSTLVQWYSCRK